MNYITVTCPHCELKEIYFDDCIYTDELGTFVICIECDQSFDVDYPEE